MADENRHTRKHVYRGCFGRSTCTATAHLGRTHMPCCNIVGVSFSLACHLSAGQPKASHKELLLKSIIYTAVMLTLYNTNHVNMHGFSHKQHITNINFQTHLTSTAVRYGSSLMLVIYMQLYMQCTRYSI